MPRRRRRKLYGAAAAAVARKRGRRKSTRRRRRHNPAMNPAPKRRRRRKARKSSGRRRLRTRRRKSVSRGAFRTYRRSHGRRRRRRVVAMLAPRRRRRRRTRVARSRHWGSALRAYGARRRNPSRRRRYGRRRRRNPRPSTQRSLLRARRAIRNRYKTALGRATQRRYRMRSNPGLGTIKSFLGQVLPVALSLYGARAISYKLAGRIPGLNRLPSQYQGTAVAAAVVGIAHVATKRVAPLRKWRFGIMVGTGINLIDNVLSAFAPANVKAMFGLGDIYDNGLSEYVGVGEYMSVGATPIDDDIALSDYVSVDGLEEELGVEEDLGLEEELGDSLSRSYLGGVSRDSLLKQIPSRNMLAPVPARSFTKEVRRAGSGYDKADVLYTGIFGGGF